MADRNLVLQLLITAKDQATSVFSKVFSGLNDATNVLAGVVREAFSNLFGGGIDSAAAFEQQMNAVAAKGGYTAAELEKLRAAAESSPPPNRLLNASRTVLAMTLVASLRALKTLPKTDDAWSLAVISSCRTRLRSAMASGGGQGAGGARLTRRGRR